MLFRSLEPQGDKKKVSGTKSDKTEGKRFGKSGAIKKRVVRESVIREIGSRLEEPRTMAEGSMEGKKGGTIVSNNKDRDASITKITLSALTAPSTRVDVFIMVPIIRSQ